MIVWRERKNNSPLPHFPWCGRNSSQDRVAYPKLTVARKNALMAKYCQALMHFTCVETMSLMASMWLSRPWVVVSKMIWILWKRLKEAWRKRREESIRMAVAGGSGRPRNLLPMTLGTKKFKQDKAMATVLVTASTALLPPHYSRASSLASQNPSKRSSGPAHPPISRVGEDLHLGPPPWHGHWGLHRHTPGAQGLPQLWGNDLTHPRKTPGGSCAKTQHSSNK